MGQKDITEKKLEEYNDVFSDILNTLLFDGEHIVSENDLEPTSTVSQYKADDDEVHEQERDVSKFWKQNRVTVALIGAENQTGSDPDMILRVIVYDGASYRSQVGNEGKRYPVITLVLYFGYDHHWNQRTLYDRIEVPENLKKYVSDYRMNVFEIAYLDDNIIDRFGSDFGIVARYFSQMQKKGKYEPTAEEMKHVDEVLKLMKALTGDRRFQEAQNNVRESEKGGSTTMIDVFGDFIAQGEARGEERGGTIKLIHLTQKKLEYGRSTAQIAEDLFEDKVYIDEIVNAICACPADATDGEIYEKLMELREEKEKAAQ